MHEDIRIALLSEIGELTEMPVEAITDHEPLSTFGLDSLQALQLLVFLERSYQVILDESDLEKFTSVQSIVHLVEARMAANAPAA